MADEWSSAARQRPPPTENRVGYVPPKRLIVAGDNAAWGQIPPCCRLAVKYLLADRQPPSNHRSKHDTRAFLRFLSYLEGVLCQPGRPLLHEDPIDIHSHHEHRLIAPIAWYCAMGNATFSVTETAAAATPAAPADMAVAHGATAKRHGTGRHRPLHRQQHTRHCVYPRALIIPCSRAGAAAANRL